GLHPALEAADEACGVAGEEVAQLPRQRPVLIRSHPPDAGCRALVDVPEETGAAGLLGPLEDPLAARAYREDAQEQVECLADRPGVGVRAEVAGALALGPAQDLCPRELLAHGHGEVRVGLVIPVLDV